MWKTDLGELESNGLPPPKPTRGVGVYEELFTLIDQSISTLLLWTKGNLHV
jgi:hypothetical protein